MVTTTSFQQTKITSLQIVDPSELSGIVGKTPFGGTDLGSLAKRSGDIGAKGATVVVYTVEGKFGTQHVGNVEAFRKTPGIVVYTTASKSQAETSLSFPGGVSIGVSKADDQAANRTDQHARDWTVSQHGTQQTVTSTLSDLGKQYITHSQQRPHKAPAIPPSSHGGILLGPVHLARGTSGRIVFKSGASEGEELAVVYTLFGMQEFHSGDNGSTSR